MRHTLPSAVSAPYSRQGWGAAVAGWLAQNPAELCIFADNPMVASASVQALEEQHINPKAVWDKGPIAWQEQGGPLVTVKNITVDELAQGLEQYVVVDVRGPHEWRTGTIPGALKIPLGELSQHLGQFEPGREYAVVCAHGNRSQTGASYLTDQGLTAGSVVGGMAIWMGAGHPIERT